MLSISKTELDEKLKNYIKNIYGYIEDLNNKIIKITMNQEFFEKANEDLRKLKEKFETSENISINTHDLDKNNKLLTEIENLKITQKI